jgi:hypothetical protein
MGGAASVESISGWSDKDLAAQIMGLGTAFEGYGPSILANALDGSTLLSLDTEGLNVWFEELEVKKAHQTRLARQLKELVAMHMLNPRPEPLVEPSDAPSSLKEGLAEATDVVPGVHNTRDKQFTGFLSHFKFECGACARIALEQLKKCLPPGDDVFLDSGKSSA